MKKQFIVLLLFFVTACNLKCKAYTILAVSGSVTNEDRPLLLKNRDSSSWNIRIKIGEGGNKNVYLCQSYVPKGQTLYGFNRSIIILK